MYVRDVCDVYADYDEDGCTHVCLCMWVSVHVRVCLCMSGRYMSMEVHACL